MSSFLFFFFPFLFYWFVWVFLVCLGEGTEVFIPSFPFSSPLLPLSLLSSFNSPTLSFLAASFYIFFPRSSSLPTRSLSPSLPSLFSLSSVSSLSSFPTLRFPSFPSYFPQQLSPTLLFSFLYYTPQKRETRKGKYYRNTNSLLSTLVSKNHLPFPSSLLQAKETDAPKKKKNQKKTMLCGGSDDLQNMSFFGK